MRHKSQLGFTLIEMLVVVAIAGILAALAYPMYREHVSAAKRAEGKAALLANAGALERFYTMNNTYTASLSAAGAKAYSGDSAGKSAYTIGIVASVAGIADGYTMTATPVIADTLCGALTITHAGTKSFGSANGTVQACW